MEFNSVFFFLTLTALLVLYRTLAPRHGAAAKAVVLGYSYFFYGMWSTSYLALLLASSIVDYTVALAIERRRRWKGRLLLASLTVNLGLLAVFKYGQLAVDVAAYWLGVPAVRLGLALPVGISFYTFHTISYAIDVYRGDTRARSSLLDVALFVAYFPLLVAGPIIRARQFMPQLEAGPRLDVERVADGVFFVLFGLCLKCVLADNVAPRVDELFSTWRTNGAGADWAAAMLFGTQIYGDFAGYSIVAFGLARLMGYDVPMNFRAPFGAAGFADFWRRWHVTLSSWLRDYLYVSLGGNRRGLVRTYLNVMITMLLGGLWHGASALFVLWGGLHGVLLCLERALAPRRSLPARVTFLAVSAAWIPFRSESFEQAIGMLAGLFTRAPELDPRLLLDLAIAASVALCHYWFRDRDPYATLLSRPALRSAAIAACALLLYYGSGRGTEFIYFRF